MRASSTSSSIAVVALATLMLFGLSAQASAVFETKTVTAPIQSNGTKCSEIRLAAAFAYNDAAAFKAECRGYFEDYRNGSFSENRNLYGIRTGIPGSTRRKLYLGKKFYNPTMRKWRIIVSK